MFYHFIKLKERSLIWLWACVMLLVSPLKGGGFWVEDPSPQEVSGEFKEGSEVHLYLPNLPYLGISHDINGALLRPAENEKGWVYDLALSHTNIEDRIWEFELRREVHFQDGSPFNADAVLRNMEAFQKKPYLFSKIHLVLDRVEKINDYRVRFVLNEPYGIFLHDAVWLQFYTDEYLKKFGWNGKPTCPNLVEPGPYGLGPYVLKEGYVEGDRSSEKVVLEASRNYWGAKAKVEKVVIHTRLGLDQAVDKVLNKEGELDICPVPFSKEVETVLSPNAKLASIPSLNNYAVHINLINGHPLLQNDDVRYILNHCIDQEALLKLSMMGEGLLSPTMVSPLFYRVSEVIEEMFEKGDFQKRKDLDSLEKMKLRMKSILKEKSSTESQLPLRILVQESYAYLMPDLKFFLAQVGIELEAVYAKKESEVFTQLFKTYKKENETAWDLLIWGNYDWFKHPYAAFFVYRPFNVWSTIPPSPVLEELTDKLFRINMESDTYPEVLRELMGYVYRENLMLYLPTPNNVFAINKEVVFRPGRSAYVYLRDLEVTDHHWSVRGEAERPPHRKKPYAPFRPESP